MIDHIISPIVLTFDGPASEMRHFLNVVDVPVFVVPAGNSSRLSALDLSENNTANLPPLVD
jgi:hypothetical protein